MTTHLDTIRTHIISMICSETNENILNNIEILLKGNDIPSMGNYSAETLKDTVLNSREDICNGRIISIEKMKAKHPRQ